MDKDIGERGVRERGRERERGECGAGGSAIGSGVGSKDSDETDFQPRMLIDSPMWLSTKDAAIFMRRFRRNDGKPSDAAIRTAVWRKQLRPRKVNGRLYFYRPALEKMFSQAPFAKGNY